MTTAERIEAIGYRIWVPLATAVRYVGKHRRSDRAALSLQRMLYLPRHAEMR